MLALIGVRFLGILPGLLITVGLSVMLLLSRESRPLTSALGRIPGTDAFANVEVIPEASVRDDVLIFRLDAALMFINATWMRDVLTQRETPLKVALLDLSVSPDLDIKRLDVLAKLNDYVGERGSTLWIASAHKAVCVQLIGGEEIGTIARIPRFLTIGEALAAMDVPEGR
jgi:MFS superfamily sulfate permease-like transporter